MKTTLLLAALLLAVPACRNGDTGRPKRFDAVRGEDVPPPWYVGCPAESLAPRGAPAVATPAPAAPAPSPLAPRPKAEPEGRIPGTPSIRVVWEALAVELERSAGEARGVTGSRPLVEGLPGTRADVDHEVILLNASFVATPEQDAENRSRKAVGRVARVTDADMNAFLEGLERIGFFQHARPTESVRYLFPTDRARGRITVERDGNSVTLLSMRGLGLQASTRAIPGIYAQAKQAVVLLKNRVPTLRVKDVDVDDLHPKGDEAGPGGRAPAPAMK
jgi:hypothetical protein